MERAFILIVICLCWLNLCHRSNSSVTRPQTPPRDPQQHRRRMSKSAALLQAKCSVPPPPEQPWTSFQVFTGLSAQDKDHLAKGVRDPQTMYYRRGPGRTSIRPCCNRVLVIIYPWKGYRDTITVWSENSVCIKPGGDVLIALGWLNSPLHVH